MPLNETLTAEELERYKRQLTLRGFDREKQLTLRNSTAMVAGIGGLGGTTALYLAAAGIGKLILIHDGNLTHSNLNRQIVMTHDHIGQPRVEKAAETIRNFNPYVKVEAHDHATTAELLDKVLPECQIMLDCRHNFPERRILNAAAIRHQLPLVEAAMNDMEAYLFNIVPGQTPCLHCLFAEDPPWDPYGFSVLGALSGSLGCMAAIEAIKLLTGYGYALRSEMLYYDLAGMDFRKLRTKRKSDCPACSSN